MRIIERACRIGWRGASDVVARRFVRVRTMPCQKMANALAGNPVPPVTGTGATVSRNSHRFSLAAVSATASRSWLSRMSMPSAVIASVWTGRVMPSTSDGVTSCASSLPRNDDAALLQPGRDRGVVAGFVLADVPRPELRAPRPAAGAQEDRVARTDLDAGLLLPGLEVFDEDRRARLEIRQVLQPRDVDEDAARDDAVLQVVDAEFCAALLGVHVGARVAVVGLVLVEDVAERVDVAVRVAVIADAIGVGREARGSWCA